MEKDPFFMLGDSASVVPPVPSSSGPARRNRSQVAWGEYHRNCQSLRHPVRLVKPVPRGFRCGRRCAESWGPKDGVASLVCVSLVCVRLGCPRACPERSRRVSPVLRDLGEPPRNPGSSQIAEIPPATNRWRILCKPLHPLITSVPARGGIPLRFVDAGRAGNGTQPADRHLGKCAREASMAKLEPEPARLEHTKLETTETRPTREP
jgi:hypothetical protein